MSDASSIVALPRPHPYIETAFVGGEAVLLNVHNGTVFALNPSASAVWLLLDGERTAEALADELSDIIEVAADVLLPDVERALGDFRQLGLMERSTNAEAVVHTPMPLLPPPDP